MKTSAIALVLAVTAIACEEKQAPPTSKESMPATSASGVSSATAAKIDTKTSKELPATSANADAVKAYREARDFAGNARTNDAIASLKKALSLDPKFASAQAGLGWFTPGAEGDKMIAAAIASGAALPEAEKLVLQFYAANHAADFAKAIELSKKLTEALPASWEAQSILGESYNAMGKANEAKAAFKKALELEPTAGPPHNALGYISMFTGDSDDAIAHLKKYAELRPKEPNPHDSYGEALLVAGKYDESKAEFEKTLEIDPKFVTANNGIGFGALYKGDYAKAYEAFGKLRDAKDADFGEQASGYYATAWAQAAEKKIPDALKTLDALAAAADKANDKSVKIGSLIQRAVILVSSGKPADGIKVLDTMATEVEKSELADPAKVRWTTLRHSVETSAYQYLNKPAEADKARAATEESAGKADDEDSRMWIALAKSAVLAVKNDSAGAATALKDAPAYWTVALFERSKAEDKAGQKDAATATRATIQKMHMRNGQGFFIWKQTAPAAAAK